MSLTTYRSKRNLKETPEPSGKKNKEENRGLKFVVQRHAARRLHYDFRLELDGALKSWAIPKGPSLDPTIKRLAIEVEDHPLEYASFEGIIPQGQYGAGKVSIWDEGSYTIERGRNRKEEERLIREQLKQGELKFTLHGKKLKGAFVLIRLERGNGNEWLLVKKKDEYQTQEEIIKGSFSQSPEEFIEGIELMPRTPMPHHIKPMLAYLIEKPFDQENWIFEIKWDGYRALAEIAPKKILLYSRHFHSYNEKFPSIIKALEKLKGEIVLDGEIVAVDKQGRSHFQLLQNYLRSGSGILRYCIFDILYYKGHDLRKLPLQQRKQILKEILQSASSETLYYSDYIKENGKAFFQQATKRKLEGIIAKDAKSSYVSVRSRSWLKIKTHLRQEVVIAGFTQPKGSRKGLGALIVGVYKKGKLHYAGHVGGGFTQRSLKETHDLLVPLVISESPFSSMPKKEKGVTWVKPIVVCEVSFQEWTQDGVMRQPIFQGIRTDKPAKKVSMELPLERDQEARSSNSAKGRKTSKKTEGIHSGKGKNELSSIVSNPNKIFWPKEQYTKKDLLDYYQKVAPFMLPHLKDRPIVLHRYPNGIEGKDFYQKEAPDFLPNDIHTVQVQQSDKKINYIVIPDVDSLLYVVNLGSIEIHPFLSRFPNIDYPDFLVFDIDPLDLPFDEAVNVAQEIHRQLEKLDIAHFCKTSGKRGLHIYVPLGAQYEYEVIENLAKLLAYFVHQQLPDLTSLIRDPAKRKNKIYLDYLQNARTKTMVAPYSVRPVEGAPVSTPLEWKEVKKGLDPHDFNIKTILPRLKKKGDLFKEVLNKKLNIKNLMKKIF